MLAPAILMFVASGVAETICECKDDKMGMDYLGERRMTLSGYTCQRWDSQWPHKHDKENTTEYPNAVNNEANYCRNPDGKNKGPWCYTMDPSIRNEFCDIPICGERLVSFANTYGDSMVLQRAPKRAVVWGYAECEGAEVTVTMGTLSYNTTAIMGPAGLPVWRLDLLPESAGGPHTIDATSGGVTVSLQDVMFGDVYVCAGQSNMEFPMSELNDPEQDIEDSVNYPDVRTFRTARGTSATALYDLDSSGVGQGWAKSDGGDNISEFSAVCWLFGRNLNTYLGVPIGLIESAYGGTRIEAWTSVDGLDVCWPDGSVSPATKKKNEASTLWNAMIHPFLDHTIYGVVLYQGEADIHNPDNYTCALQAMVSNWRGSWLQRNGGTDPLFPFGQVQLAPRRQGNRDTGYPDVRWSQTSRLGYTPNVNLHNVYTATAVDLPDFDSPSRASHPRYKRPIAERLYYGALQVAYGITSEGAYKGPIPTSITLGADIQLVYDNGEAELEQRDSTGFDACCAASPKDLCPDAGTWTAAEITLTANSTVTLTNPCAESEHVTSLRYLWRESPCELELCPIYRVKNQLPAPPYKMYIMNGEISPKMFTQ